MLSTIKLAKKVNDTFKKPEIRGAMMNYTYVKEKYGTIVKERERVWSACNRKLEGIGRIRAAKNRVIAPDQNAFDDSKPIFAGFVEYDKLIIFPYLEKQEKAVESEMKEEALNLVYTFGKPNYELLSDVAQKLRWRMKEVEIALCTSGLFLVFGGIGVILSKGEPLAQNLSENAREVIRKIVDASSTALIIGFAGAAIALTIGAMVRYHRKKISGNLAVLDEARHLVEPPICG